MMYVPFAVNCIDSVLLCHLHIIHNANINRRGLVGWGGITHTREPEILI